VSQRDYVLISGVVGIRKKVRNEGEDFGRDLVDRCNPVSPRPNQAEDLESLLFENIELEYNARQSRLSCSVVRSLDLSLAQDRRCPANSNFSLQFDLFDYSRRTSRHKPHIVGLP
jgi:hypothetical protein